MFTLTRPYTGAGTRQDLALFRLCAKYETGDTREPRHLNVSAWIRALYGRLNYASEIAGAYANKSMRGTVLVWHGQPVL